jgi:hypothetical protein
MTTVPTRVREGERERERERGRERERERERETEREGVLCGCYFSSHYVCPFSRPFWQPTQNYVVNAPMKVDYRNEEVGVPFCNTIHCDTFVIPFIVTPL